MNRADYGKLLTEIMDEISEPEGTFQSVFGKKTEKELEEIRYISGIALYAADRFYSGLTRMAFEDREAQQKQQPKQMDGDGIDAGQEAERIS